MENLSSNQAALQALRINFAQGIDERNWALLENTLAEEVLVDYTDLGVPPSMMKKNEVVNLLKSSIKDGLKTQHYLSNYKFDIEGNEAKGTVYVFARHYLPSADGTSGDAFDLNARYIDSFIKTENGWKINQYKLSVSWFIGNPASVFNL
jgi:SnoaL-like domain